MDTRDYFRPNNSPVHNNNVNNPLWTSISTLVHATIRLFNATSSQWSIYQIRNPIFMDFVTLSSSLLHRWIDGRTVWSAEDGKLHDPSLFSIHAIRRWILTTMFIANGRLRLPGFHRFSFDSFQSNCIRYSDWDVDCPFHRNPTIARIVHPMSSVYLWSLRGICCWSIPITIIELDTLESVVQRRCCLTKWDNLEGKMN